MAKCCAVTNCEASNRDFGTILFCFPKAEELRQQWIKALGKPESWTVPEMTFVCWSHFQSKYILQDDTSFRRSADAVPSLYLNEEFCASDSEYFCRFCARQLFSELMGTNINDMNRSEDAGMLLNLLLPDGIDEGFSKLACDECIMQLKLTMRFIRNCAKATKELENIKRKRAIEPEDSNTIPAVKTELDEFEEVFVENIQSEVKVEVASLGGMSDRDDNLSDTEDDIPLAVKFKQELTANELKCSYCSFNCSRRIQLASHMKKHRDILPPSKFNCPYCDFTCTKRVQLVSHRKKHVIKKLHLAQEELSTDGKLNEINNQEKQHQQTYQSCDSSEEYSSSEIFKCSECPYTCKRIIQLASHKKKHFGYKHKRAQRDEKKTSKDVYKCEFCDFICKQRRQMAGHRASHSELIRNSKPSGKERDHMCSICGKILSTRGSFFVHMKYHNDQRDYPCSMCDKKFYSKRDVTMHIESLHQKKVFECEICGVKCTWKNALNKHMRKHNMSSYKHECSYCGKKFMAANELRLHVWRHTGQQLTCDICGAGYRFNFLLTQHKIRAHGIQIDGVKLYKRFRKDRSVGSKRTSADSTSEATSDSTGALPSMQIQSSSLAEHQKSVEDTSSSSYSSDMPTNYPQPTSHSTADGSHLPVPFHHLGSHAGNEQLPQDTSQNNLFSQIGHY